MRRKFVVISFIIRLTARRASGAFLKVCFLMACVECARLLAEYERRQSVHATAVQVLYTKVGPLQSTKWLTIAVDRARLDSETARLEFNQHERSHSQAESVP